jgi:hypothetical protein
MLCICMAKAANQQITNHNHINPVTKTPHTHKSNKTSSSCVTNTLPYATEVHRPLIWNAPSPSHCASLTTQSQPRSLAKNSLFYYSNLSSGDGGALAGTTLSRAQVQLASLDGLSLGHNLLALGKDQLDVAGVRHVWVDLKLQSVTMLDLLRTASMGRWLLTRPCARYVRRRCFGAWLTWMCFTTRLPVSRPLVSALASAFLRRPRRNSADLTGQRARVTPKALPIQ